MRMRCSNKFPKYAPKIIENPSSVSQSFHNIKGIAEDGNSYTTSHLTVQKFCNIFDIRITRGEYNNMLTFLR